MSREEVPEINQQNGDLSSTPARQQVMVANQNPQPSAQDDAKAPEEFKITRNMMFGLGALILIMVAATITTVIIYLTANRFDVREETEFITNKLPNSDASMGTKILTVKDPQNLNSKALMPIYARTVSRRRRIPKPIKNIKGGNGGGDEGENRLLEQEKSQDLHTSLTCRDPVTDSHFTLQSNGLQIRASFNIPVTLAAILNSLQPQILQKPPRSLQQSNSSTQQSQTVITKQYSFSNIGQQIADNLKENLKSSDPNVQVTEQVTYNLEYNNQTNAYQFVSGVSSPAAPSEENVTFYDPADIPVISDPKNQAQLAKAVGTVMNNMLQRVKKFFQKRGPLILKAAQMALIENDPSHGATSFYLDQPEDIGKACTPTGQNSQQCEGKIISSNLINVATPKQGDNITPNTNVIVHIDF